MSIFVMTYVWKYSRQKGASLLLMLAIADFAHDDGYGARPSIETLAEKIRGSVRHTSRLINQCEQAGELSVHRRSGRHRTHLYQIIMQSSFPGLGNPDKMAGDKMSSGHGSPETLTSRSTEPLRTVRLQTATIERPIYLVTLYEGGVLTKPDDHRDALLIRWVSRQGISLDMAQDVADDLCMAWPGIKKKTDPRKRYMNWCRRQKAGSNGRISKPGRRAAGSLPSQAEIDNYAG